MHYGAPAHIHIGTWTLARRPLFVGAIHGLAGSGALTALVLTTLPSTAARLTYMVVFGLGSTLGMAALSGLLGWPLARAGNYRGLARAVSLVVGCVSTALGLVWGYPLLGRLFYAPTFPNSCQSGETAASPTRGEAAASPDTNWDLANDRTGDRSSGNSPRLLSSSTRG